MSKNYDAIVIGAGSVGCPTAYFLARAGHEVLCIDERASSGQGSNKAAIGGVRATHSDPAKITICLESLRIFSEWKENTGTDIGWKMGGYSFPVYREQEETALKSILTIQKEHDLNIDWHGADEIQEIITGVNPDGLMGGTYSPEDGQVSPLLAIESFTDEARRHGAEFVYRRPVTELLMDGDRVKGIKSGTEEYLADVVVNAAGDNASQICSLAGLDIPVIPDLHEAGITSPTKQFLKPLVVDLRPGPEGKTSNFYFGQVESGQLIFCYTPKPIIPGTGGGCTSEFMPVIARRLVDLIPRLKNLLVRRIWRGTYPMTPDGVAIVGKAPGIGGLYLGIGMCGQGFMMGPGVGHNLEKLISTGKPLTDQSIFKYLSPDRDFHAAKKEVLK